ncbi:MAG: hypothetical protein KBB88_01785 [Candidatus Pacebacteria bacterium]|nr:hypothetical protein [Candidatus Paceibacterota bacterium]
MNVFETFASWLDSLPWALESMLVLLIITTSISILLWIIGLPFILRQKKKYGRVHKQYTYSVKTDIKDTENKVVEKSATSLPHTSHHENKKKDGYPFSILLICIVLFAIAVLGGWSLWLVISIAGFVLFILLQIMFGKGIISNIFFIAFVFLVVSSMTRAWPIDLTHFQKNSEKDRENTMQRKVLQGTLPDHYATMYITCDGVRYEGLVPGVWYDVPETINNYNLIVTMSGNEIHTGPDNPLVIWNKSSRKDPAWFTRTDIRLMEPCSGKNIKITLMPIQE